MDAKFQQDVGEWVRQCFGDQVADDRVERARRMLEEALELAYLCGLRPAEAHFMVDFTAQREQERSQQADMANEVGGLAITLASLCYTYGISLDRCARSELTRVRQHTEEIGERHLSKPRYGGGAEVGG